MHTKQVFQTIINKVTSVKFYCYCHVLLYCHVNIWWDPKYVFDIFTGLFCNFPFSNSSSSKTRMYPWYDWSRKSYIFTYLMVIATYRFECIFWLFFLSMKVCLHFLKFLFVNICNASNLIFNSPFLISSNLLLLFFISIAKFLIFC